LRLTLEVGVLNNLNSKTWLFKQHKMLLQAELLPTVSNNALPKWPQSNLQETPIALLLEQQLPASQASQTLRTSFITST